MARERMPRRPGLLHPHGATANICRASLRRGSRQETAESADRGRIWDQEALTAAPPYSSVSSGRRHSRKAEGCSDDNCLSVASLGLFPRRAVGLVQETGLHPAWRLREITLPQSSCFHADWHGLYMRHQLCQHRIHKAPRKSHTLSKGHPGDTGVDHAG